MTFAPSPYRFVRLLVSLGTVGTTALFALTGHLGSAIWGIPAIALALPGIAIAFALVSWAIVRVSGGAPVVRAAPPRLNPLLTFYLSVLLFVFATGAYMLAELDRTAFGRDSSCARGFAGALDLSDGACRLERATIAGARYHSTRGSVWYEVDVRRPGGERIALHLRGRAAYDVYRAALDGRIESATLQTYRKHVVAIETPAGTVATAQAPIERSGRFAILGAVAGIAGLASMVGILSRSF